MVAFYDIFTFFGGTLSAFISAMEKFLQEERSVEKVTIKICTETSPGRLRPKVSPSAESSIDFSVITAFSPGPQTMKRQKRQLYVRRGGGFVCLK